ncbi:MAG: c-type cytochrome [Opitutaceae bacterium]|nr:c-type cytochrome [Opitutaceae bacterium]
MVFTSPTTRISMARLPNHSPLPCILALVLSLAPPAMESRAASVDEAVARVRQQGTGPSLINDSLLRGLGANPANLEAGRTLFNATCALCHLENMRGKAGNAAVIGSDLTDNIWDRGGRPADIFTTIMNGALDTGMPPWKDALGEEKVALIVAYILSRLPVVETPISAANAAHNVKLKDWLGRLDDIPRPAPGEAPRLVYFPVHLPEGKLLEAIGSIYADGTVLLYDQETLAPHSLWSDATIARERAAIRGFHLEGRRTLMFTDAASALTLSGPGANPETIRRTLAEVVRRKEGIEIRTRATLPSGETVAGSEVLAVTHSDAGAVLRRTLTFEGIPAGASLELTPGSLQGASGANGGIVRTSGRMQPVDHGVTIVPAAGARSVSVEWAHVVASAPQSTAAREMKPAAFTWDEWFPGPTKRPGYRAVRHPLPRLPSGEDRVLPFAMATDPVTGTVYVASGKLGEIFQVRVDSKPGSLATLTDFTGTHFQDVLAMAHDGRSLLVQHRRNLTRLLDSDRDGVAERLEHLHSFPQLLDPKSYDWGYGLVPDKNGGYIVSFAAHAVGSQEMKGSGSAIRLNPDPSGWKVEEVAFGLRNPVGWTPGPDGDIFFTDNQGNWMASNRLSHLVPDRFYGFPNPKQLDHRSKPVGPTAVWVPYAWAKSINGVTYDTTRGKFGPFAGHFFLAEVMEGGAIFRAQLEKVKDQYQGACFPFWNRGLLGPVTVTFDHEGRLWVGGLTEPGWMRQPDRGALYSIEYTGKVPFEIQSIHAQPDGFRIRFTAPPSRRAAEAISYRIEHYRYEYSSAYGSREIDRTAVPVRSVTLQPDGTDVDLVLPPLVKGRVYRFDLDVGITSERGDPLVNDRAAYTLNEIPDAPN